MQHARTPIQRRTWQKLESRLKTLILLPLDRPKRRMDLALGLLRGVIVAPETALGAMALEYFDDSFSIGQQALRAIAETVSHYCGGEKASFSTVKWPPVEGSLLTRKLDTNSMENNAVDEDDQRGSEDKVAGDDTEWEDVDDGKDGDYERSFRIFFIRQALTLLFSMPMRSHARVQVAAEVFILCTGTAIDVNFEGERLPLAKLLILDQEWKAIALEACAFAILGMAQCLSARYRGKRVTIWTEVVAWTSDPEDERLDRWVVLPEDKMERYISQHGGDGTEH